MIEMVIRLIVLTLAWFAVSNAIVSGISALCALAVRRGETIARPRLLLTIRLLPATVSLLFAGAMFLPTHWMLEPRDAEETFGLMWYGLAAVGGFLIIRSGVRAVSIAIAGRRFRFSRRASSLGRTDVHEVADLPGVSLAGVLKPEILVGPRVVEELSPSELDVAIAHEVAHRDAFDNLSRWVMRCAPDLLSDSSIGNRLEQDWRAAAESRADARATRGDTARAVHLASALIKVARLSSGWTGKMPAPSWSTLHDSALLELRVRHLVNGVFPPAEPLPTVSRMLAVCIAGAFVTTPLLAGAIHHLTETLVAFLP